jgi:hypothetical protein
MGAGVWVEWDAVWDSVCKAHLETEASSVQSNGGPQHDINDSQLVVASLKHACTQALQ